MQVRNIRKTFQTIIAGIVFYLLLGVLSGNNNSFLEQFNLNLNLNEQKKSVVLENEEAVVLRVIDGDTIQVLNSEGTEETVRMLLIDTPESVHPNKPSEKFGKEASDFTKKYLQGKKITLEKGVVDKDRYGRTLAYVFVDGTNFNKLLIEKGYARVAYVQEPNTKYLDEFKKAEEKAKEKGLNIWSIPNYVTEKGFDMNVIQ